jgi:hypothetical protein
MSARLSTEALRVNVFGSTSCKDVLAAVTRKLPVPLARIPGSDANVKVTTQFSQAQVDRVVKHHRDIPQLLHTAFTSADIDLLHTAKCDGRLRHDLCKTPASCYCKFSITHLFDLYLTSVFEVDEGLKKIVELERLAVVHVETNRRLRERLSSFDDVQSTSGGAYVG